ncbi:MAG TPA: transketolase C-terminal domain-containing protein, partial [Anaerolineae bacterium]|nr:transketolase C-terminal domain-containing protein [Anaerolineae bacterium]
IPERFFQMGIAEQNMMGVAAGMALMGKIPFVGTFAVFASRRACDQVAISVGHCRANVKIVGAYPGLVSGNNGATHQAMEDMAIMRAIPHMMVVDPADDVEMAQAVRAIAAYQGPVYLRATRDAWPRVSPQGYRFELGKAVRVREGGDITLVGSGMMTSQCLEAAELLAAEGIAARVLHVATVKPIDVDAIVQAAEETGALVTAENHSIYGGLGSAVAEVLVEHAPAPMARIGIRDCYGECGTNEALLAKYGLSPVHIAEAAHQVLQRN